uniref:Uncharacterized protein n=1 Tax=Setaria italica TaxID=4555 RepID=K3ZUT6_SETIT
MSTHIKVGTHAFRRLVHSVKLAVPLQALHELVDVPLLPAAVVADDQLPQPLRVERELLPLLLHHDARNRGSNVVPAEPAVVVTPRHLHADAALGHHPRDEPLVDDEREHHQRVPETEALGDGAPPAVREEGAHRRVRQHAHLRHPAHARRAATARPLLEPFRQQWLLAGAGAAAAARRPERPQEAHPGELEPQGELMHARRRHRRLAAERDAAPRHCYGHRRRARPPPAPAAGGRHPTAGLPNSSASRGNTVRGSASGQLRNTRRRQRSSVLQVRSMSETPDALGRNAAAIHAASWRRKARDGGEGNHLGIGMKSSTVTRGWLAFSRREPLYASMVPVTIRNIAQGT